MEENGMHFGQYCYAKYTECCTRNWWISQLMSDKIWVSVYFSVLSSHLHFDFFGERKEILFLLVNL